MAGLLNFEACCKQAGTEPCNSTCLTLSEYSRFSPAIQYIKGVLESRGPTGCYGDLASERRRAGMARC